MTDSSDSWPVNPFSDPHGHEGRDNAGDLSV
jgi:hypothetical protein